MSTLSAYGRETRDRLAFWNQGQDAMRRHSDSSRNGLAAVELAVVLPVLLLLLLGTLELGRVIEVQQSLCMAAREGGRQASTGRMTNAEVEQVVLDYLAGAGIPVTGAQVEIDNLSDPGTDATEAVQNDRMKVRVTLPYVDVRLLGTQIFTAESTRLRAEAIWFSARDRPYPDPNEPAIE